MTPYTITHHGDGYDLVVRDGRRRVGIRCARCKAVSYNDNDIEQRYCGYCHRFHGVHAGGACGYPASPRRSRESPRRGAAAARPAGGAMTLERAKELLDAALRFGDNDQIAARELLEAVAEASAKGGPFTCAECRGDGIITCESCGGQGSFDRA